MIIMMLLEKCKIHLQKYKELKDIIAILGMDELSEEDKLSSSQGKKNSKILISTILCSGSVYRKPWKICFSKGYYKRF